MTARPPSPPDLPETRDRRVARSNTEAAAALVGALVAAGVRHGVVSPGSRNTPLMLALAAAGIEVRAVLDERVAGFYALGLARASRRPVALACTSGSAGAHYLPALVEARASRVPLVVLTADRPPELHGCGAPQTMDQARLFGVHVKRSRTLAPPQLDGPGAALRAWRSAGTDATAEALACPMGPVHLDVQFREPLWMAGVEAAGEPPVERRGLPIVAGPRPPAPAALAALRDRLRDTPRGVIICGPDAAPDGETAAAIRALGAARGWPVLAEAASGVRFAGQQTGGVLTAYDALLRGPLAESVPDAVLRFGRTSTSKPLAQWLARVAVGRLITVDPAGERHDPDHLAAQVLTGDAPSVAAGLLDADAAVDAGWSARWTAADASAAARLDAACATGWWSGAIVRRLVAALPAEAALHAASSMPIRDLDGFARRERPLTVYSSRGTNGIDGTFATALGEARIGGARPLALLIGDLAALHDAGGLLFAGALRDGWAAPVVAVVVDNGGGGIFEYLAVSAHPTRFEQLFLTPQPARFDALCAAAGVDYVAVDDADGLDAALTAGLAAPGITVIHARIDRTEDVARHREAWAACAEVGR